MKPAGQPNHVLMTTDTIGGVWTYAIELSRGLCERGIGVTLAAMGDEPSARQLEEADIDGLDLEARPYKLEWMEEPWQDIAEASIWLSELAEHARPDLVHLNTLAHGALAWDAPVLSVGHSCVSSWFEAVKGEPAPEEWDRYRQVVERSLKASDMVAAPSATMMQALQRHYGVLERTRVIYNGRKAGDFLPADSHPAVELSGDPWGDPSGQPGVLTAGRLWDEAKNVGAVAEAAADIECPVFVAGSDTHPDGGSIELAGVEMLGRLDPEELAAWYARSTIYALPARYEPFGLTVLEAALAGNALVLGDIATLREIWGDAALFVDPDKPGELAKTINTLIADGDRRQFLADRARTRALQLSVEAMVEGYLEAYADMSAAAFSSSATSRSATSSSNRISPRGGRS
jgi:glycosyltransferase involved in cell wall biosynthesis